MWTFTGEDEATAKAIGERLPERLFDAHAHLYEQAHISPLPEFVRAGPERVGTKTWVEYLGRQLGHARLEGMLAIPFPSPGGDAAAANRFVIGEIEAGDAHRGLVLVGPSTAREEIESLLDAHARVVGFKVYHVLADRADTWQCSPADYIPEWAWQLAEVRRLVILLHMVRDGALADPVNVEYIRSHCERYPRATLVLAHAARGFHAPNTCRGIASLRGLANVVFDTSAICEAEPIRAILDEFGPTRIMWGSDFPVAQQRGRAVTLGTGFAWITTDQVDWNDKAFFGQPVLVGLESVRALLNATDQLGLDRADLEDIFRGNARRVFGLAGEPGNRTQELYVKAKTLIPGGTQLLSKRPELGAPQQWPAYFREARGCEIWDIDGRHYYDCSMHGIGGSLLGFRDPDVTRAVQRRLALGSFCTLNPPEEVELAERLCELHPWADQARFVRTGGESMAVAVRIARATTDRSVVAVCGYHGWHDWYLAANLGEEDALRGHLLPGLEPLGVPRELRGTCLPFTYNNRAELSAILADHGDRLAAVVMEPMRYHDPEPGFLEFVRDEAHRVGALLIFDEITIGWRLCHGGAHLRLGVEPDIAVFGKTLSNGHLMGAVIGRRAALDGAHNSFISSTYWTEGVGPVAALVTVEKLGRLKVPDHCHAIGQRVQRGWRDCARIHGLPITVGEGHSALPHFQIDHEETLALQTLFVQEMLARGFLARTAFYVSLAHTDDIVDGYLNAVDEAFAVLAKAVNDRSVEPYLHGPIAHTGFRRLL
jgi:glutamate-1-semialdehyde 2,1-aminomutase